MKAASHSRGPSVEYLLKEVSFSTCDNRFFGELEKEMLIPNTVNIHGRMTRATGLEGYKVRVEFPQEAVLGYVRQPLTNAVEEGKRVLNYKLADLINFEDYWWFPMEGETVFSLALNLLPPFQDLSTVGLSISCRPDVAVGLETEVTVTVRLEAVRDTDLIQLRLGASANPAPGISVAITNYSAENLTGPVQTVLTPRKAFPFPRLSMKAGQIREYTAKLKIASEPSRISFLRCQQDILSTKLIALSHSVPTESPCSVSVIDEQGHEIPILRTVRSTVMQANAQVMYAPFSVRKDEMRQAAVIAG